MVFKNALWAAGFPEQEDGVLGAATVGSTWEQVTELPARLESGSIRISEHGSGYLLITANTGVDIRRAEVSVDAANDPQTAAVSGQVLTVAVLDRSNLGAIKTLVDGLTGTPFTTAYVDGAQGD